MEKIIGKFSQRILEVEDSTYVSSKRIKKHSGKKIKQHKRWMNGWESAKCADDLYIPPFVSSVHCWRQASYLRLSETTMLLQHPVLTCS